MKNSFMEKIRGFFIGWLSQDVEKPRDLPLTDFDRIQYELRPGDVLLIDGRSRVSQVIKLITQSSWSHSALYIGRIHEIANHDLRKRVTEFYHGEPDEQLIIESCLGYGIIISPLSKYKEEHIRICRPKGISRQDAQEVIGFAIHKLGHHYDMRQIFDLMRFLFPWGVLPRRWRTTLFKNNPTASTKESCSSFLAEAFQSVDFPILPVLRRDAGSKVQLVARSPRLYTPSDFDYSPFFEIIKYPIVEISDAALYRKLPWNREGFISDDEGRLYASVEEKKPETQPEKKSGADDQEK